jgi:hypothetical protein
MASRAAGFATSLRLKPHTARFPRFTAFPFFTLAEPASYNAN